MEELVSVDRQINCIKASNTKTKTRVIVSIITITCICFGVIYAVSYQNTITPTGIVIHHSALPFRIDKPTDIKLLSDIHQARGNSIFYWGKVYYIGYHYIILPDGTVVVGRPENCRGAHATSYNNYIGICLIGDFSETDNPNGNKGPKTPTPEQMNALILLAKDISIRYKIESENIVLHKQVNPKTECPGENFLIDKLKNSSKN